MERDRYALQEKFRSAPISCDIVPLSLDDPSQRLEEVAALHFVHPCKSHRSLTPITTMMVGTVAKYKTQRSTHSVVQLPSQNVRRFRTEVVLTFHRYVTITLEAHNVTFLQIRS